MAGQFDLQFQLPCKSQGSFTCRKSVMWDRRLYFPSEGRHAMDFFAREIWQLQPGLNPRSWVPEASLLTTRPLKPFWNPWLRTLESEITATCYVNLFTPLLLPCCALTKAWKSSCCNHCCLVVWGVSVAKIQFRTGGKIHFQSVLRRGQRVRAGSVCYIYLLLVLSCVTKGQRYSGTSVHEHIFRTKIVLDDERCLE
jgi:hypothetical protein